MLSDNSNLWLVETLWRLGAIEFGSFTLGRTAVDSPIYLNVRKLIGYPTALWRAAHVIHEEITVLQTMRDRQMDYCDLVAGVPLGGLHIATAYSLTAKVPMIYLHPAPGDRASNIEGVYDPGQKAIIMDDLVTGGGSIVETAERLRAADILVPRCLRSHRPAAGRARAPAPARHKPPLCPHAGGHPQLPDVQRPDRRGAVPPLD